MIQIAYVQNTKSTKNNIAKQLHFMKTTISIFSSERFTVIGRRTVFRLESKITAFSYAVFYHVFG